MMKINMFRPFRISLRLLPMVLLVCVPIDSGLAQSNFTREHAEQVLEAIKGDVKKNYYDPTFRGIDLETHFKTAKEQLKSAPSGGHMMGVIAQALLDFDDSHLFFVPPARTNRTEYGWVMQAIGDQVYVSAVKPGSDAESKGLKEGDQLISVGGFAPTRQNLWKIEYLFKALSPQAGLRLVVLSPDGKERQLDVRARVTEGKQIFDLTDIHINDFMRELQASYDTTYSRLKDFGDDLLIWKLPTFAVRESEIESGIGRLKKYKTVILDLRGNGGGYVTNCERLISAFFDKEIVIGESKGRKESKPIKLKPRGTSYNGKLIVLIDSDSASASEVFARAMQVEKRATVIGDRSAGAVMTSKHYPHQLGLDTIIPYGVSVTVADLIMSDGKSLEKVGVIPDELKVPTANDLALKSDPVLAHAAHLAGVNLESREAGALFPIKWRQ